jgi:UV DNA damage endonuclease
MRISMHPDQFTLINSLREEIFERSKMELKYHTEVLDLMKLDLSAKVQIHVGGAYNDKQQSMERFVTRFRSLKDSVRRRLVIENDDKLYDVGDCLKLNEKTQIPVLFDAFHHKINNKTQLSDDYFERLVQTWDSNKDGIPMADYSSQKPGGLTIQHADRIDLNDFDLFLKNTERFDFDIMLEIKDKEKSALRAVEWAANDRRVRAFFET